MFEIYLVDKELDARRPLLVEMSRQEIQMYCEEHNKSCYLFSAAYVHNDMNMIRQYPVSVCVCAADFDEAKRFVLADYFSGEVYDGEAGILIHDVVMLAAATQTIV